MRFMLLATLALASAIPVARALPTAAQIAAAFHELDTTRNGALNAAEWERASFALFRAADKNNNDVIDADELKGSTIAQDTFLRIDADRDGRLSIGEYMELRREIFAVADIDHDDYVTFVEYELLIVFEEVGWNDRNQSARIEVTELRAALTKAFERLDVDRDGQLDKEEAGYMQPERFDRFDKNKDGRLGLEDLVAGYRSEFGA